MQLTPEVGVSGVFELRAPFNTKLKPNTVYNCRAVRKLSEMLSDNEDPFTDIYEPNNLTKTQFDTDLAADASIAYLQAADSVWVAVPTTYIISYPSINGVTYRVMGIGINLGALPDTLDLAILRNALVEKCQQTLGVIAQARDVVYSNKAVLSHDQAALEVAARQQRMTSFKTAEQRIIELSNLVTSLQQRQAELERYIEENYIP